jgi:hypothetical protein
MKQISISAALATIILVLAGVACAPAPSAAAPRVASTPTLVPLTGTPAAPAEPTQPRAAATPTVSSLLRTDTVEFVTTLSSDDTVAVVDDVQKLDGVQDAQSSGQAIQVTYDPGKINLQQIVAAIENDGVRVKK